MQDKWEKTLKINLPIMARNMCNPGDDEPNA